MARGFNGTSDQIQAGLASTNVGNISMSLWVNQISASSTSGILCHVGDINADGWGLFTRDTALFFYCPGIALNTYAPLTNGVWTHLTAVNTGNPGAANWIISIAGVDQGAFSSSDMNVPSGSTWMGAASSSFYLNSKLADVAIWTTSLSAPERAALAGGARPGAIRPASLAAWWPLDGI